MEGMASIFTRIINGELSAAKVYEDEHTIAILDISPAARGHTLVICKEEIASLLDLSPELVAQTAQTVQRVARAVKEALHPDGFNVVQNDGPAAGQVVFHYHVHVIPRWDGDSKIVHWIQGKPDQSELQEVAAQVSAALHKQQ
jgi:histidine triad (HIT) family protein